RDLLRQTLERRQLADVERQRDRRLAPPEPGPRRLELRPCARHDRHARSGGDELPAHREADPRRGAGDQRDAILEHPRYFARASRYRSGGTTAPSRSSRAASHRGRVTRSATTMPSSVLNASTAATADIVSLNASDALLPRGRSSALWKSEAAVSAGGAL